MPELETVVKPKTAGFVDSKHNNANKRRIEEEQAEIDKLTAAPEGEEETSTEEPVEEKVEAKKEENLSPEEKTYKKRHTDARKYINEQDARIKALEQRLNNPDPAAGIRPPKSDEDIGAWAEKYPDVAAIVETIAEKKAQEKFSQAEDRLQRIDEINAEAERTKAETEIRKVHSDFDELKSSDAFHDWADKQPKWVKDALYENSDDPMSVVRVIDLYKVDNGMDTRGKKSSTKEAASAVVSKRTSSSPDKEGANITFKESDVQKMSTKEFESNEEAIMASMKNKSFYDISGAAR